MPRVDLDALGRARGARARPAARDAARGLRAAATGDQPVAEVVTDLLADHPGGRRASCRPRHASHRRGHRLLPRARLARRTSTAQCRVGVAPPRGGGPPRCSRGPGPTRPDAPSHYDITPPEPSWPAAEQAEWLSMFSEHRAGRRSPRTRWRPGTSRTVGRCGASTEPGPAHADRRRFRRGVGALRRGADARGGLPRRRPALPDRRRARGAGARHAAGVRDRAAHRRARRRGRPRAGSWPTP